MADGEEYQDARVAPAASELEAVPISRKEKEEGRGDVRRRVVEGLLWVKKEMHTYWHGMLLKEP